jgi:hypothetical protein
LIAAILRVRLRAGQLVPERIIRAVLAIFVQKKLEQRLLRRYLS